MTTRVGTLGFAGSGKVPLLIGASRKAFLSDIRANKSKTTSLYAGLPFRISQQRGDYLVAPARAYTDDFVLRNVRAVRDRIRNEFRQVTADGGDPHDHWENSREWNNHRRTQWRSLFKRQYRQNYSGPDLWSLMILDWLLVEDDESAADYFSGQVDVFPAFRNYLGIRSPDHDDQLDRWWGNVFAQQVTRLGRSNITLDLITAIELERAHARRLKNMREIGAVYEGYARVWLLIFSLFTGAASAFALKVASEAFMGYMDFCIELYNAEKDGIITEEESQGAWFALIGVFIPMGAFFGKAGQLVTSIASLGLLAFALSVAMIEVLVQLLGQIERRLAAADSKMVSYAEVDRDMSVFVPASFFNEPQ